MAKSNTNHLLNKGSVNNNKNQSDIRHQHNLRTLNKIIANKVLHQAPGTYSLIMTE